MEFKHISVLLKETIDALNVQRDGIYLDGTLGGGGHSAAICEKLGRDGILVGIDRDETAIKAAKVRLENYDVQFKFVHANFQEAKEILMNEGLTAINGAVLDLGVSSHQLDEGERGFSYRFDATLDMRMDKRQDFTAKDLVNNYSYEDLTKVLFAYGEEKNARRIAKKIIEGRPIETTTQLVEIIKSAFSVKQRYSDKHPAKRTFQALRIEVNNELDILGQTVEDLADMLVPGARIAVITFHSLEDRIIKSKFLELATGCTCPKEFPICICGKVPKYKVVSRKPVFPSEEELSKNPRSASAKLRVLERI